ncbi:MAG: thioredoxin domain-containing protein [Spirochaetes bacterium]|nr:thioredoxin domain-containing protein [Spirochaetota bacterium]
MRKHIIFIAAVSVAGALVSSVQLFQHYFPNTEFGMALCGNGIVNPCRVLCQSGFDSIFGFPIAGMGLLAYLFIIVVSSVTLLAGEDRYSHCFAVLAPVSALSIIVDIVLGSILIYLRIPCRLCVIAYVINILIFGSVFLWYLDFREINRGVRDIYAGLVSFLKNTSNRPLAVSFALIMIFMFFSVVSLSAYMNIRGEKSEESLARMKKFDAYYRSLPVESVSLPPSSMIIGGKDADITIVIFTDFICPACRRFYEIEKELMSRFWMKIRIEYYHFPLDIVCNPHAPRTVYSNSCVAAQAFTAAARRGIFKDLLQYHYEHYHENSERLRAGDVLVSVKHYFKDRFFPGDYDSFLKEVLSEQSKVDVYNDVSAGGRLGVRAVPTLYINGRRLEGIPDADLLSYVLARELGVK